MTGFLRVSILGSLPGGEVWSVNPVFRTSADFPASYDELLTIVPAINAVVPGSGLTAPMNSNTQVTGVRVESRSTTGELQAVYEAPRSSSVAGTGAAVLPYQSSIVFSLRTAVAGASGRGRLYWPATGVALTPSTMRVTNSVATAFRSGMNTYLGAIGAAIDVTAPDSDLVVWSRTLGTSALVNRTQVGDVLDVQRRRRDSLAESIVSGVYP